MNLYYRAKHWLKIVRWQMRRSRTARQWGYDHLQKVPAVLGNAMPKSGSHLISQVLRGLTQLGPFVDPGFPPVNRSEDNRKLPENQVLANIERMRPGDIAYGYIQAREPFISALTSTGRATVFVYRDPRDVIISHVFYATEMHQEHGMHDYYTNSLQNMEQRINAAIQGVEEPDSYLASIRAKYENYLGWFEVPQVLSLRFEDLIRDRGVALNRLLDYLELRGFQSSTKRSEAISVLENAIAPHKSGTFRKGRSGDWQAYFTEGNKSLFKNTTGDMLVRLGYEGDNNW